jgi:hypothetical protein
VSHLEAWSEYRLRHQRPGEHSAKRDIGLKLGKRRSALDLAQKVQQRRVDFPFPFQRKPMAGPLEYHVASEIGDVLVEVGEGVR